MSPARWRRSPSMVLRQVVWLLLSVIVAGIITLAFTAVLLGLAALHTRDDTAARSSARVTQLQMTIADLEDQAKGNTQRIGQLDAALAAVSAQVERMGARPIVTVPTTTTTVRPATTAPKRETTTTTTTPRPTTTTTTAPKPPPTSTTTSTTRPCRPVPVIGRCVP